MKVIFEYQSGIWQDKSLEIFDDDANDAEIDEAFNEWCRDHYKASWQAVNDETADAYATCF